jgi:hypothetical protein
MAGNDSVLAVHAALEDLFTSQCPYLTSTDDFRPPGCLLLSVNVGEAVSSWDCDDQGDQPQLDAAARGALACDILSALISAHRGQIAGLVTHPPRTRWHEVGWVQLAVAGDEAAQQWLIATVTAQALAVEVRGRPVAVPARAVLARLPPGHVQVVFRGVPYFYARTGLTEAVLRAVGYSSAGGTAVVHERAGVVVGTAGERLAGIPSLDTVVAVVRTPPGDRTLQCLPASVPCGGGVLQLAVEGFVVPGAAFSFRRPPPPPPPQREAVLRRVGAAHGITAAVLATAPPLLADLVGQRAQPPGSHTGLGFGRAERAAPAPPARPPPLPPPAVEFPMPAADPPPRLPLAEPVFGAALEYAQDWGDLSYEDAVRLVSAVRECCPTEYRACVNAARVSDLTPGFRYALYCQAACRWGEEVAAALRPGCVGAAMPAELERQAGACLPASVLDEVGSGAGEDVGEAGDPQLAVAPGAAVQTAAACLRAAAGVRGGLPTTSQPPPPLPTPPQQRPGRSGPGAVGRPAGAPRRPRAPSGAHRPVLQTGRQSRPPREYWMVQSRSADDLPALAGAAAGAGHTSQPGADQGPQGRGPGRQRQ